MSDTERAAAAPVYTASHWGLYAVQNPNSADMQLTPYAGDADPTAIGLYLNHPDVEALRVRKPAVRKGWLAVRKGEPGTPRGSDEYLEIEWDEALNLVAEELQRVRSAHGNEAIYGGSYGWASAGRFHHAQSQIHRFLNGFGGYVRHVDSYSLGAARALMPYLVASMDELVASHTDWDTLAEHTQLFLSFGGVPAKNAQIAVGGTAEHRVRPGLAKMRQAGVRFINISPVRDDIDTGGEVEWWPIRPNTDTALLLALAHTLCVRNLHDTAFLNTHCVGFEVFEQYVLGQTDGQPKTPAWAAAITGLPAADIEQLALDLAANRSMINMAWALQRAHHGEQPFWALISVAAMLGQIGLPGGGFAVCYGAANLMGSPHRRLFGPTFDQGRNAVKAFIPVARIADMLLKPGESFTYQGATHTYPDIRLVYWAGGNPFHHHQDLARLTQAWQKPDTIIVHEQYWTPSAKMADIVLPASTTLERDDIFYATREPVIAAMKQVQAPVGEARDDYSIFADLAARLGFGDTFTEGLDATAWLTRLYDTWRDQLAARTDVTLPPFDTFWQQGIHTLPQTGERVVLLDAFRQDPVANPLRTASGRIEIFSKTIADFGLADCPGYACWREPHEWLGSPLVNQYPLHLISDQPKNKLHSQLDHSPHSRGDRINEREPIYLNAEDAQARGIEHGTLVRTFNARGSCLAAAVPSPDIRPGVVRLSTGAWFDPARIHADDGDAANVDTPVFDKHGNPNALTADVPASSFSQGCTAQTCLVEVERWQHAAPPVTAYTFTVAPPAVAPAAAATTPSGPSHTTTR
ncbi:molybdopterin-dependent oxidoreductase [Pigmentiphaga aceris]|uniref:Molybdopterin-dependent oxidoreductase n=1 Tax=Pigmentiphaga aceris TaxID=1940612 RepID=A0A5C0AS12_9BURK|nr:molybdopterin-dependent oxidoreductase [Pigmentiphaga aceris]QEI04979.1 molybdopterin-dependent oxidoreductase [Pigmentiphaga aceris]